jgi:hypothetical protein
MSSMNIRVAIALIAAALLAPAALAWPGKPAKVPPKPPNPGAPPPAWIETQSRSTWLAYGSYCWRTTCVDMIPPQTRPDLPLVAVKRGRTVRVHLGFSVRSARVSLGGRVVRASLDVTRRVVSWQAARGGIVTVFARPEAGDASYHARLRLG